MKLETFSSNLIAPKRKAIYRNVLCYLIIAFCISFNYSCKDDYEIQRNQENNSEDQVIKPRTSDIGTVYVDTDDYYVVSTPDSQTTILDFDGDYEWSDNSLTTPVWHAFSGGRVEITCNCVGYTNSTCYGHQVAPYGLPSRYGCKSDDHCSQCEMDVIISAANSPVSVVLPNGIFIREN
jgi:hypothetical protein